MTTETEWTPIESSFLKAHKYDPNSRRLSVEYLNGSRYTHEDVPIEKHEAMVGSASPGSFYNKKIKTNHPGRKL